jgi:hypothetical protein
MLVLAMRLVRLGQPWFASLVLKLGPNREIESAAEQRKASDDSKDHSEPFRHGGSPYRSRRRRERRRGRRNRHRYYQYAAGRSLDLDQWAYGVAICSAVIIRESG